MYRKHDFFFALVLHITSVKHKLGKTRTSQKEACEATILQAIKKFDNEVRPEGKTLLNEVKVTKTFLKASVPIEKQNSFRALLEEGGYRLKLLYTCQLTPLIRMDEEGRIRSEISASNVAVSFDGTTRLGEAQLIVLRYVTAEWKIKQAVVRLQLLAKSLKVKELAREIITVLA